MGSAVPKPASTTYLNMLIASCSVFTLLALTSAQNTEEPTTGQPPQPMPEPSDWWNSRPSSLVKNGFQYEKAPVEHTSMSSGAPPVMWKICKQETGDDAIGCLYHNRMSLDGGAFEEGNLPSEGLTYCIPYAGGSDKCCASDDTTSVVAN